MLPALACAPGFLLALALPWQHSTDVSASMRSFCRPGPAGQEIWGRLGLSSQSSEFLGLEDAGQSGTWVGWWARRALSAASGLFPCRPLNLVEQSWVCGEGEVGMHGPLTLSQPPAPLALTLLQPPGIGGLCLKMSCQSSARQGAWHTVGAQAIHTLNEWDELCLCAWIELGW